MKFAVMSLGCKVNAYEAEATADALTKRGWQRVPYDQKADAFIVYTCAVTNTAAMKSRKMLSRAKKINPAGITVAVGCYAQTDDEKLSLADIIVGTAHKQEIPDILSDYFKDRVKQRLVDGLDDLSYQDMSVRSFAGHTRAFLKIQDGCNQFCTYCLIPYVRGRERSLSPERVVEEAVLLSRNYPEIVLTGIHTGRYGGKSGISLASLIKMILKEAKDLCRLRISSVEITEIDDELIALIKDEPRIARHLHIPLQSGSDGVLRRMGRPYTTEEYRKGIKLIRQEIGDIAVSCDLMTGFPGESEDEFATTMAFLRECAFSFLHVFPYSPRELTPAASYPDQISPAVKKARTDQCLALNRVLKKEFALSRIGKTSEVITETHKNGYTEGYTSQYIPVRIYGTLPKGRLVTVIGERYDDEVMYCRRKEG